MGDDRLGGDLGGGGDDVLLVSTMILSVRFHRKRLSILMILMQEMAIAEYSTMIPFLREERTCGDSETESRRREEGGSELSKMAFPPC